MSRLKESHLQVQAIAPTLHAALMYPDLLQDKRTVCLRKTSAIAILCPRHLLLANDVIFTEINFAVEDIDQWFEVRNNDCCDIELDEWSVGDTSLAGGLTPCSGDGSDTILPIGYTTLFIPLMQTVPTTHKSTKHKGIQGWKCRERQSNRKWSQCKQGKDINFRF